MNPLFKNASRAIKAALRAEFRAGAIGRAMRAIERKHRGKSAAKYVKRVVRKIQTGGTAERLEALRRGGLPELDRYAKKQTEKKIFGEVVRALGPLGSLLESLLRPTGKALAPTLERELSTMQKVLTAFGFHVIPPPPQGANATDAQKQRHIEKHLTGQGFKIIPNGPLAQSLAQQNPAGTGIGLPGYSAPRGPHALPGWAERARQQQQKPPTPNRPPQAPRKTVDVDFGEGRTRRIKLNDPILTGEMIPVVSSNVHSIGFDINPHSPVIGTLKVRFLQEHGAHAKGAKVAGPLYFYFNVPSDLFRRFRTAASKGKWVWDNLRIRGTIGGKRFDYRLEMVNHGYVPRIANEHEFTQRHFLGYNKRTGEHRLIKSRPTEAHSRGGIIRPDNGRPGNGRPPGPNRGKR